jgi:maleylacetoacetate isomerase
MELFGYWRSSSAYRVRIGLALKGLAVTHRAVHLVRDGGEQNAPGYRARAPQGRVPLLVLDDGRAIAQSLAILEWLEEGHPNPPLLPADPFARAAVRATCLVIAADAQPLHNSSVLSALETDFGADKPKVVAWVRRWVGRACAALEAEADARGGAGPYLFGAAPTLADVCLVPHLYTARRWELDLAPYPRLLAADAALTARPEVAAAAPEVQADAPAPA